MWPLSLVGAFGKLGLLQSVLDSRQAVCSGRRDNPSLADQLCARSAGMVRSLMSAYRTSHHSWLMRILRHGVDNPRPKDWNGCIGQQQPGEGVGIAQSPGSSRYSVAQGMRDWWSESCSARVWWWAKTKHRLVPPILNFPSLFCLQYMCEKYADYTCAVFTKTHPSLCPRWYAWSSTIKTLHAVIYFGSPEVLQGWSLLLPANKEKVETELTYLGQRWGQQC